MTDALSPLTALPSHDAAAAARSPLPGAAVAFAAAAAAAPPPPPPHHHPSSFGAPVVDGAPPLPPSPSAPPDDDDGQISCFCGYADDDGSTVACDRCNKWNHTICYYPDGSDLPDEHFCVDCVPRYVDEATARERQRARRARQDLLAHGGGKRPSGKSHKKKVKESPGVYTNGWAPDKIRHDRNSASPRDQPPPAKRPKTSHRASDSTTSASVKGHSRKRTATNAAAAAAATHASRRSASRSPETPIDLYSPEFLQCYYDDHWKRIDTNLHADIRVTNKLSHWVFGPEGDFQAELGLEKADILMRFPGEPDDIPGKAEFTICEEQDARVTDGLGRHPRWKRVVITGEPVQESGYIGELKGHVGFRSDYCNDELNRWDLLRHPEPFVFFHPRLPIYIDARNEGTELRYIRRSCRPNAKLQVLVTDKSNYRFCFMATEPIDPGVEVSVAWDTSACFTNPSNTPLTQFSPRDRDELVTWVSTVLSNCGPCACELPRDSCWMSRFDHRGNGLDLGDATPPAKLPTSKKRKKAGNLISPANTNALNSRSGSEARKVDPDDERTDSRSSSGSGRGSTSRDITPNTHYSANGSLAAGPELSERDRKKLADAEERFRRQEERELSGKHSKKKRSSAGSNLNTPSATASKPVPPPPPPPPGSAAARYADAGVSKLSGLPTAKSATTGKRSHAGTTLKAPANRIVKVVPRPKPPYVDAAVQCDMDEVDAERRAAAATTAAAAPPRWKVTSVTQRLLERCARNNALSRPRRVSRPSHSPAADTATPYRSPSASDNPPPPTPPPQQSPSADRPPPPRDIREPDLVPKPEVPDDVPMPDAPPPSDPPAPAPPTPAPEPDTNHVPEKAPEKDAGSAPPPPAARVEAADAPAPESEPHKPADMRLQMPPPSRDFSASAVAALSAGTPGSITGSLAQSPGHLAGSASVFSPSPARKKLSLSDYTRRKAKEHDAKERETSPASATAEPVVPPLSAESGGSAVDDVKMEDAQA